jgi:hypothetical protein
MVYWKRSKKDASGTARHRILKTADKGGIISCDF